MNADTLAAELERDAWTLEATGWEHGFTSTGKDGVIARLRAAAAALAEREGERERALEEAARVCDAAAVEVESCKGYENGDQYLRGCAAEARSRAAAIRALGPAEREGMPKTRAAIQHLRDAVAAQDALLSAPQPSAERERIADLEARVWFLLQHFNAYGPEGFTFPDGETWERPPSDAMRMQREAEERLQHRLKFDGA